MERKFLSQVFISGQLTLIILQMELEMFAGGLSILGTEITTQMQMYKTNFNMEMHGQLLVHTACII